MTVNSDLSRVRYVANGQTTEFAVPFPYMTNNDGTAQLSVYLDDRDTPLLENKDYRVVGFGNYNQEVEQDDGLIVYEERFDSGTVVFYTAPEKGKPIAIIRNVSLTQGVQFINGEEFPAEDFSNALDKLTMAVQEVKENLDRAVMFPPTSEEKPTELRDNIVQTALEAKKTADEAIAMVTETKETLEQGIAELQEETQKSVAMIEDKVAEASNQVDVFTENAISQVDTVVGANVEKSRVWAEGEQTEVEELGGSLSSMGAADLAYAIANAPEDTPIDASGLFAMNVIKGPKGDKGDKGDKGEDGIKGDLSNPFSLLDYKWSEYELSNASWLISNGTFHSGATYVAVYELLLKIYNGTETKEGVSVKLATEEYSDTDFVIDTSNTTFRLPVKVKLASGNAVCGNGYALGLTNGEYESFLVKSNPQYQQSLGISKSTEETPALVQKYTSKSVYDTTSGTWSVGVTQDPTKSGIETSSSGLKLYFYVGETIQDANVINASGVLTRVSNSIDRTILTDRETVMSWGMPDYSTAVSITAPYIATYPCWLVGWSVASAGTSQYVYVNGVAVARESGDYACTQIMLDVGDEVTISAGNLEGVSVCAMKGIK